MLQKYSIFRQVYTIQRQFQHIRTFSRLDEFTVVKNPPDEQKRYEELYDELVREGWDVSKDECKVWRKAFGLNMLTLYFAVETKTNNTLGMSACSRFQTIPGAAEKFGVKHEQIAASGMLFVPQTYRGTGLAGTLYKKLMADHRFVFCYGGINNNIYQWYKQKHEMCHLNDWHIVYRHFEPRIERIINLPFDTNITVCNFEENGRIPSGQLAEYGQRVMPYLDRRNLIQAVLNYPNAVTSIALDRNDEICGLCQFRFIGKNICVRMFYCNSMLVASTLIRTMLLDSVNCVEKHSISITTVSKNEKAIELIDLLIGEQPFYESRDQPQSTVQCLEFPKLEMVFSLLDDFIGII